MRQTQFLRVTGLFAGPPLDQHRWQWNRVTQMVLYGLGSPSHSVAARYPSRHVT